MRCVQDGNLFLSHTRPRSLMMWHSASLSHVCAHRTTACMSAWRSCSDSKTSTCVGVEIARHAIGMHLASFKRADRQPQTDTGSQRVFPQNTTLMHKAAPEPAAPQPANPSVPESTPAGPQPQPDAGPPTGPPRAARRASQPEKKRRKTSDVEDTFRLVAAALAQDAPPLLPTPRSLFGMLCGVFELEFPGRLPQHTVEQALRALDAEG